jgi:nitrite reductase/ring-hydroxylating ferredoxin subunit
MSIKEDLLPKAPSATEFPEYPSSWYLFGCTTELSEGPASKSMLGRQLVAFKTKSGKITVMDASCSHLGADLGCGRITGESIQCPYHNWKYGVDGKCTHIPGAKVIPDFAKQTIYPVSIRHGYVFFFNGPEPLFDLPFFFDQVPDGFVAGKTFRYVADCSWYMNAAHGFDIQHFDAVHDRKLLAPPTIDCPSRFARRNTYFAEVVGDTVFDKLLKVFVGDKVTISITIWGGTFACVTGAFKHADSRFVIATRPLEDGRTLCEGIVYTKRNHIPFLGNRINACSLWLRRTFTHGYLADEARRLKTTRYIPEHLIENDQEMINFFQWLVSLPQNKVSKEGRLKRDPEPDHVKQTLQLTH